MSYIIAEEKGSIESLLENITMMFFEDYNFITKHGFSSDSFADFESFSGLMELYQDEYGDDFKDELFSHIKKSLFSITDGVRKKDFEFDDFENQLKESIDKYLELADVVGQIEEVILPWGETLFCDQVLDDVELLDNHELMDFAIEYLKQNDLIQSINTQDGEMYLMSNLVKKASG